MDQISVLNARRVSDYLGIKVIPYENLILKQECKGFIQKYEKYLNSVQKEDIEEFFNQAGLMLRHTYYHQSTVISFDILGSSVDPPLVPYESTPKVCVNNHLQVLTKVKSIKIENDKIYINEKEIYDLKQDKERNRQLENIRNINGEFEKKRLGSGEENVSERISILQSYFPNLKHKSNTTQLVLSPFGDIFSLRKDGTLFRNDKEYDKNVQTIWEKDRYNKLIIFEDNRVEYLSATFGNPIDYSFEKILYENNFLALLEDGKLWLIIKESDNRSVEMKFYGIDNIEYEPYLESLILYKNGREISYSLLDTIIEVYE